MRIIWLIPWIEAAICRYYFKMSVRKNFANFTGKYLCWSFFLNKVIKKKLQHRRFPVKFVKCLKTPFFIEHLWRLLLHEIHEIPIHWIHPWRFSLNTFMGLSTFHMFLIAWATFLLQWITYIPNCLIMKPFHKISWN